MASPTALQFFRSIRLTPWQTKVLIHGARDPRALPQDLERRRGLTNAIAVLAELCRHRFNVPRDTRCFWVGKLRGHETGLDDDGVEAWCRCSDWRLTKQNRKQPFRSGRKCCSTALIQQIVKKESAASSLKIFFEAHQAESN